jgi:hypothetical protein
MDYWINGLMKLPSLQQSINPLLHHSNPFYFHVNTRIGGLLGA